MALSSKAAEHAAAAAEAEAKLAQLKALKHEMVLQLKQVLIGSAQLARIPHGAALVENTVSKAPGFWIENVIVMAGVPAVMNAMLDAVTPLLAGGTQTVAQSVAAGTLPEGAYAAALGAIATAYPSLSIGSYPSFRDGAFHNEIVVRGKDAATVDEAKARIGAMIAQLDERR